MSLFFVLEIRNEILHNNIDREWMASQADPAAFALLWDVSNASFDNLWPFYMWVQQRRQNPRAAALKRLEEQENWGKKEKESNEWGRIGTN